MQFDYFYGSQAEQFSFYRIPKVLFTDPQFKPLSTDAKVLYGILLDRIPPQGTQLADDQQGQPMVLALHWPARAHGAEVSD